MPERHSASERSRSVVAVGHAGAVILIEAADGRIVWERSLAEFPAGAPCEGQPVEVCIVGDQVIAACMGHVFALSLEDGSQIWQVNRRGRGAGATSLASKRR